MRYAIAAAAALSLSSPAEATIGLLCKPSGGVGPQVGIVFGAGADGGIAAVNLKEGAAWRSSYRKEDRLVLTRSRLQRSLVRADFLDEKHPIRQGRLEVRISGHTALGTFSLNGRRWAVRCVQD